MSNRITLFNYPRKHPLNIKVFGLVTDRKYQELKYQLQEAYTKLKMKSNRPYFRGMLEFDWMEFISGLCKEEGKKAYQRRSEVAVFSNNRYIGDDWDMIEFIRNDSYFLYFPPQVTLFNNMALEEHEAYFTRDPYRSYIFFDVKYGLRFGRLVFELYSDLLPETCQYFMTLCLHHPAYRDRASYYGCLIHRIAKTGWLQGGNIANFQNTWPDESYAISHERRGVLSLCNEGKHSNGSQFFITLAPCQWMDGYYVAIGQLIEGYTVLEELEYSGVSYEQTDLVINICDCGVLPFGRGINVREEFVSQIEKLMENRWREFISSVSEMKARGSAISISSQIFQIENQDQEVDSNIHNLIESVLKDTPPKRIETTLTQYLMTTLLDMVMHIINLHNVQGDTIDVRDVSSETLTKERYLDNLYSIPELDVYLKELLEVSLQSSFVEAAANIKLDLIEQKVLTTNVLELIKCLSEKEKDSTQRHSVWTEKDFEGLSLEITKKVKTELSKSISNIIIGVFNFKKIICIDSLIEEEEFSLQKIKDKINEVANELCMYNNPNWNLTYLKENSIHIITLYFAKSILNEGLRIYNQVFKEKVQEYDITKRAQFKSSKCKKNIKYQQKN